MSFWVVPSSARARHALLLGRGDVHRPDRRGRRVDRHRGAHAVERQALEQQLHVGQAAHGDAARPELALGLLVVGVVAVQRRHVVGDREARLAGVEQLAEADVGVLGRAEAREHAHRPGPRPVARGVDAARERRLARAGRCRAAGPGRRSGRRRRAAGRRGDRRRSGRRARRARRRTGRPSPRGRRGRRSARSPRVVNRSRRSGRRSRDGVSRSTRHARLRACPGLRTVAHGRDSSIQVPASSPSASVTVASPRSEARSTNTVSGRSAGQATMVCPRAVAGEHVQPPSRRRPRRSTSERRQLLRVAVGARALLVERAHASASRPAPIEHGDREAGRAAEVPRRPGEPDAVDAGVGERAQRGRRAVPSRVHVVGRLALVGRRAASPRAPGRRRAGGRRSCTPTTDRRTRRGSTSRRRPARREGENRDGGPGHARSEAGSLEPRPEGAGHSLSVPGGARTRRERRRFPFEGSASPNLGGSDGRRATGVRWSRRCPHAPDVRIHEDRDGLAIVIPWGRPYVVIRVRNAPTRDTPGETWGVGHGSQDRTTRPSGTLGGPGAPSPRSRVE